ncbi:MAG: T9SS type A sorting domain-containing protein [Bacteroidia bacterium]|nr:T9SS type A sorting domain-containing protein [Bacteroidia bacterium]
MRLFYFLICCLAASTGFSQCIVGYYPLNGNVTDSVTSTSGTLTGASVTTDRNGNSGGALYFNGTSDFGTLVDDYDYALRTVSFWFKPNVISGTNIMYEADHPNLMNAQTQIGVDNSGSGSVTFCIALNSLSYPINISQWHHLAAVRDISSIKYYVDCNLVGTFSDMSNIHATPSTYIATTAIGKAAWGNNFYNGSLDEIRVYNCALTQANINGICIPNVGIAENNPGKFVTVNYALCNEQLISQVLGLDEPGTAAQLCIYNNLGQQVFEGRYDFGISNSIPELKTGIYYYRLYNQAGNKSGRISLVK